MKKLLLFVAATFVVGISAQAQCTPDPQYTESGIYPDSATNFAPACVGEPYTQLITNVVPADTTIDVFGFPATIPIDSITVNDVTGLPPGMTFSCNPASCSYPGGTTGCAVIQGTCNTPGEYVLTIELSAYVGGAGAGGAQNFTLSYYKIVVSPAPCNTNSVLENTANLFSVHPNPTSDKFTVTGLAAGVEVASIEVFNMEGKMVKALAWNGASSMDISTVGLNTGMYFVNIKHNQGTEVIKLIKE